MAALADSTRLGVPADLETVEPNGTAGGDARLLARDGDLLGDGVDACDPRQEPGVTAVDLDQDPVELGVEVVGARGRLDRLDDGDLVFERREFVRPHRWKAWVVPRGRSRRDNDF